MNKKNRTIELSVLTAMRGSFSNYSSTRWAAYENPVLASFDLGLTVCLAVGPQNDYNKPPLRAPYSPCGPDDEFLFVGWVNLETGLVEAADIENYCIPNVQ